MHLRPNLDGLLLLLPSCLLLLSVSGRKDTTTVSVVTTVNTDLTLIALADFNATYK